MNYVLKGNIVYSKDLNNLEIVENGYLVCKDGLTEGVYTSLPESFKDYELTDYKDNIIIPGLIDLHTHAPQYSYRGTGMDLELLDWLNKYTYPEEARFKDLDYAKKAYLILIENLRKGATTRFALFSTVHEKATVLLMDLLEESGLVSLVGKLNMDRNCPDYISEKTADNSIDSTIKWIEEVKTKNYKNTYPILTPRFTPTCSDELMEKLKEVQLKYNLPFQSHLSENTDEINWVKELCPWSKFYGEAYSKFGLFGKDVPTLMAHCVYSSDEELKLIKDNGVYIVHCPESNMNVSTGVAPIRKYLNEGLNVCLGTDFAGGSSDSMFSCMALAIRASKIRNKLVDDTLKPLTLNEVFYLATKGGGSFFGKVGSFEKGYELDAVVLDDSLLKTPMDLSIKDRLERLVYLSDDRQIVSKYVRGHKLF